MKLKDYKYFFITIGLIGVLLIASPVIIETVSFPPGEQFSEIFIIGPEKMATDIPFNIKPNTPYSVYLGVGNHLDKSAYYVCYVKFRNQTEPLPNEATQHSSPIAPLYEYHFFIQKGFNWTTSLTFSFPDITISDEQCIVKQFIINNISSVVEKFAIFDSYNEGHYYQIFIELWVFNPTYGDLEFHGRFVYFWLKINSPVS